MYVGSANSYSSVANADFGSRVSVAVARKTLDNAEAQGAAAVQMIQAAMDVGRQAMKVTPRGPDFRAERGAISAQPGPNEPGRVLDVTA